MFVRLCTLIVIFVQSDFISVTRFGEISPLCQNFKSIGQIC